TAGAAPRGGSFVGRGGPPVLKVGRSVRGSRPRRPRASPRRSTAGMGGAGFEPAKALPPDLQSGPFSHSGIHPVSSSRRAVFRSGASGSGRPRRGRVRGQELAVRLELTTVGLQNR